MKFRKKPVVIEAWLVEIPEEGEPPAIRRLVEQGWLRPVYNDGDFNGYIIGTLEGDMHARPGDWIIQGVKGELYPCKPDIFGATYEPA